MNIYTAEQTESDKDEAVLVFLMSLLLNLSLTHFSFSYYIISILNDSLKAIFPALLIGRLKEAGHRSSLNKLLLQ